jgi:hypothetical protein
MTGIREYQGSQRISGELGNMRGIREYQGSQRIRGVMESDCVMQDIRGSCLFSRQLCSKTVRK